MMTPPSYVDFEYGTENHLKGVMTSRPIIRRHVSGQWLRHRRLTLPLLSLTRESAEEKNVSSSFDLNYGHLKRVRVRQHGPSSMKGGEVILLNQTVTFHTPSPKPASVRSPVELFVYDLSKGVFEENSEMLIGAPVSGVYHSSICVFGLEIFFEGGINFGRAGSTRFGSTIFRVPLGITTRTLQELFTWIAEMERTVFQIHQYDVVNYNCHNFTQAACRFLVSEAANVPDFLFRTSEVAFDTPCGRMFSEFISMFSSSVCYSIVQRSVNHMLEYIDSVKRLRSAATLLCQVPILPLDMVMCFRICDAKVRRLTILGSKDRVARLVSEGVLVETSLSLLDQFAEDVASEANTWDPLVMKQSIDTLLLCLYYSPPVYWGPLLNTLRSVVLNKAALVVCLHHPYMMDVLSFGIRDFIVLPSDAKLALLRLACNLTCTISGAVLLTCYKAMNRWLSLIGFALMDSSECISYTGACLAVNLIVGLRHCHRTAFQFQLQSQPKHHCLFKLAGILLYNLHSSSRRTFSEPVVNMLLMALLSFKAISSTASQFVDNHEYAMKFTHLLQRCRTSHSACLICLLRIL